MLCILIELMMSLTPVSCRISVSKGNDTALKKLQVGSAVINDHLLTKIRVIFYCFWRVAVKLPFFMILLSLALQNGHFCCFSKSVLLFVLIQVVFGAGFCKEQL